MCFISPFYNIITTNGNTCCEMILMEVFFMSFNFENLDELTRQYMLDELSHDIRSGTVYISPRLNDMGKTHYIRVLEKSIREGNEITLKNDINAGLLNLLEQKKKPSGGYTRARVPNTAAETLAEGEFNRYYIRALCRRVIEEETGEIQVYRAKEVDRPRLESQMKIGMIIDPRKTLRQLRDNSQFDTILQIPSGPNSGLSVRITNIPVDATA
jgi:hypothetical protein